MPRRSRQNPEVREFVLRNIDDHPADIANVVSEKFGLSRVAANGYLKRLTSEGLIEASGITRGRRYTLKPTTLIKETIKLADGLWEDAVWRFRIQPYVTGIKRNIVEICHHGFTEILNNAVDHSGSEYAVISFTATYAKIEIIIIDSGIGIFQKIQNDFRLQDAREALLELSKGGLTSNPAKHAGEGIFYTSRMFDKFSICSGNLYYSREKIDDDDWLIEVQDIQKNTGTIVRMEISTSADWTAEEVFERYKRDRIRFNKTHVPLRISQYPGEQLVSRSQAKRILSRFSKYAEVMLDFRGVDKIGQAFADEVFRVFVLDHPNIKVVTIGANDEIKMMIDYVRRNAEEIEPKFL